MQQTKQNEEKEKGLHNKQGVLKRGVTHFIIKIPNYFFSRKFWEMKISWCLKAFPVAGNPVTREFPTMLDFLTYAWSVIILHRFTI